jgi:hypothetical protein
MKPCSSLKGRWYRNMAAQASTPSKSSSKPQTTDTFVANKANPELKQ